MLSFLSPLKSNRDKTLASQPVVDGFLRDHAKIVSYLRLIE
ncbi:hypothetical protein D515_04110 [Grimontia indica]|uniref:Uncharacterized protein n=1 Tax=Grimontia indica TaxID=1056512 RepID=R1GYM6_9GAMM|nr:hypothetical protein D515_04110 [Grimontia indica]